MKAKWEQILKDRLDLYGHRNWVVIADSAYPAPSESEIEMIVAGDEQITVVERALAILREYKHVRPAIYTDEELKYVREVDAPGVTTYRKQLAGLLRTHQVSSLLHENAIAMLDRAGEMFRVLVIKTTMQIPYTSVFVELECGYWSDQAEKQLRAGMRSKSQRRRALRRS